MKFLKNYQNLKMSHRFFLGFLIFFDVYYSFRYLLRFGSPISPEGYSLTPISFQVAKYFIVVSLFVSIFIFFWLKNKNLKDIFKNKISLLVLFLILYCLISLFKFDNFGLSLGHIVKMLFVVPIFFIVPLFFKTKEDLLRVLKKFFVFSIIYHSLYNVIIIMLFFFFGRMPGLGFGEVLGRFGGGWDDPNTFSAWLVLLIAVLLLSKDKNKDEIKQKSFLIMLLVLFLSLTFSVTGLLGLVLVSFIYFVYKKGKSLKLWSIAFIGSIIALIFYLKDLYNFIYQAKLGSAVGHFEKVELVSGSQNYNQIIKIIFGDKQAIFHENFYLQFLNNFGVIGLFLFLTIIILILRESFFKIRNTQISSEKFYNQIILVYIPVFLLMNLSIPYWQIFPINIFIWILLSGVFINSKNQKIT